ncbi:hypothetical protein DFH08DRAFT_1051637 [Mycena albidolilacea]|uniref:Fungal calcium binding protein domain-containing protein n=1 Tax=Mycena albidolilacea TaxID=1033008 RepID=A0AAD7EB49_9AGAR|nr:hypothetical protein DFH08DRAFT_1051637 [Mycena albidolilacea]
MHFSIVALAIATSALAAPLSIRDDAAVCDVKTCVLDLAPSVVSCASAAAQLAADPASDAGCLIAAAKDVVDFPPSCAGCAAQLNITLPDTSDVVGSVESGLESAGSSVLGGIESLGSDIGGLFGRSFLSGLFGGKTTVASGSTPATVGALKVSFSDPTGPVAPARQTQALKALKKAVSTANQKKFPFCDVAFGATGNAATFRCFSAATKKIGQQGPAGALSVS